MRGKNGGSRNEKFVPFVSVHVISAGSSDASKQLSVVFMILTVDSKAAPFELVLAKQGRYLLPL